MDLAVPYILVRHSADDSRVPGKILCEVVYARPGDGNGLDHKHFVPEIFSAPFLRQKRGWIDKQSTSNFSATTGPSTLT